MARRANDDGAPVGGAPIARLLAEMTVAEKLAQLGGIFPLHLMGPGGAVDGATLKRVIPDGIGQISGAAMIGGDVSALPWAGVPGRE